jgi:hypothetical protein
MLAPGEPTVPLFGSGINLALITSPLQSDGRGAGLDHPFRAHHLRRLPVVQLAEADGDTVVRLRTVSRAAAPKATSAIAAPAPSAASPHWNPSFPDGEPDANVGWIGDGPVVAFSDV